MKKIKKLTPSGIYLIKSMASANSTYFEDGEEIEIFWKYFNIHLRNYVEILEYLLNEQGFQMIIRIKPEKTIVKNYIRFKKYKNANYMWDDKEIWRIISEKFRVCIGQYVPEINKKRNCEGSLVKKAFERYIFESSHELENERQKMNNDKIDENQQNVTYRSKIEHCRLKKQEDKILHLWNSCKARLKMNFDEVVNKLSQSIRSQAISFSLLAKWISTTIQLHFPTSSPSF